MERLNWIDIAKGIGIICVVIGHTYGLDLLLFKMIFMFHMPLFFYLSGYLYKKRSNDEFLKNKSVQLLIPYFFILLLFTPFIYLFNPIDESFFTLNNIVPFLSGGKNLGGITASFWFITCLFLTQVLYNFLQNAFNTKTITYISIIMLICGYLSIHFFKNINTIWSANVILLSLPMYHIGYICANKNRNENTFLILCLALAALFLVFIFPTNTLDMKKEDYGIPIITLVCSYILFLAIKKISMCISNQKFAVVLIQLGKASFIIMLFNFLFLVILNNQNITNPFFCIVFITTISYFIYFIANKFMITRILMLGSKTDLNQLIKNKSHNKI